MFTSYVSSSILVNENRLVSPGSHPLAIRYRNARHARQTYDSEAMIIAIALVRRDRGGGSEASAKRSSIELKGEEVSSRHLS